MKFKKNFYEFLFKIKRKNLNFKNYYLLAEFHWSNFQAKHMNPILIVGGALVLLIALYFIYSILFSKKQKKDTLLLLGTMNSGKTCLFYKLKTGNICKTYTSTKVNDEVFELKNVKKKF
jgi:hypothetical protein